MTNTNSNRGIVLSVIAPIAVFMFFLSCFDEEYLRSIGEIDGFGFETNGILEGTVWGNRTLSFSRNAVTVSHDIDFGTRSLSAGTYYSFFDFEDSTVYVDSENYGGVHFSFRLDGVALYYYSRSLGWMPPFYPAPGPVFINGKARFYNNFVAEETEGGLAITKYLGSLKNLVIPAEIGGVPVVAIGDGDSSPFGDLQLATVIIPPSVTTIRPGVFRSNDLFGYRSQPGRYLSGGITIGADVTIMSNFIAYEREHLGYWLDMGFVRFYNENGRQAGKYTWTSSYDSYNYRYTFTWAFTPPPQQL